MLSSLDLAAIACEIKDAQDRATQLVPVTARIQSFDLHAAYAVAQRVCDARRMEGFTTVGRKIGFTNPSLWETYGVREPIWGYMYDYTVVHLETQHASCSLRAFVEPKIEPEIVFGLRAAPDLCANLPTMLLSIDWIAHGFEIVQSHFPCWRFQAADTIADGGLHGMLVVGPKQPLSRFGSNALESLESFSLSLSRDGVLVEVGRGSNVLGNPVGALNHLVSVLAKQPDSEKLRAGDIVTTGTITAAYPVKVSEVWESNLRGISLPGLTVRFIE